MFRLRISTKLYLLILLSLAVLTASMAVSLLSSSRQLNDERKALLQTVDDVALTIVAQKYALLQSGALSEEQAKAAALEELAAIRYGENGYVWVNDLNSVVLMHPLKPELDGKDASGIKDPNGKALFVEFSRVAKAS